MLQSGGSIKDYNPLQTVMEAGFGFVTSAAGSALGNFIDSKITKNLLKSDELFNKYLGKTFMAGLRKEAGR